ncbi:DUF975 family protein [uncultured Fusobacterium sp.]|jgi:uncharacterized membrane protein|uniref:DUF975 family protein n=1 Tax=uncultured Fusobacterium sp. TaxID=159267 RepID=UPI002582EB1C|nr:DUF975 family protein [uncultured Fusobacterium sp.]
MGTITISTLKERALLLLKGKWKDGILVNLIFFLIMMASGVIRNFISSIFFNPYQPFLSAIINIILAFVVIGITSAGYIGWTSCFYKLEKIEDKLDFNNYMEFFTKKLNIAFNYGVVYSFFMFIWGALFYFVGFICILFTTVFITMLGELAGTFLTIGSIIIILGTLMIIRKYIDYSMARYIVIDNPDIKMTTALKESKNLIDGYRKKYILLILSFIGWIILITITFGLAGLWIGSYWGTTEAQFYRELKLIKAK